MKRFLCVISLSAGLSVPAVQAAMVLVETHTFSGVNLAVSDGSPSGAADLQSITSTIATIQAMRVSVTVDGTFNGDLYAYLSHSSGLAVLLNRSGRTAGNAFGYSDDGFSITFDDGAAHNVHTYRDQVAPTVGSPLIGDWQPDGRLLNPDTVVGTDAVTAQLSVFNGLNANGDWTLFVADLSGGDSHTVDSWGLEITGVPEPGTVSLLVLAVGLLARRRRR